MKMNPTHNRGVLRPTYRWYWTGRATVAHAIVSSTPDGMGNYHLLTHCGRTISERYWNNRSAGVWYERQRPLNAKLAAWPTGAPAIMGHEITVGPCEKCCARLERLEGAE